MYIYVVNQHKAKISVQVNNKCVAQGQAGGVIMSRSIYQLLKVFIQCGISTIVASVISISITSDYIGPVIVAKKVATKYSNVFRLLFFATFSQCFPELDHGKSKIWQSGLYLEAFF